MNAPNSQTAVASVPSDLVARLRMWAIRLHKETFGSTISDGPQTDPKVEETDYWKAADRIENLERQVAALSAGPAEPEWQSWTRNPPIVQEATAYAVLTHRGDGSEEGWNELKLGIATWGPALAHAPGCNWPSVWECQWDRMYIRYWLIS